MTVQEGTIGSILLKAFYAQMSDWVTFQDAYELMITYFNSPDRTKEEIEEYREKRGSAKYLADEIAPILDHLKYSNFTGSVKFQMNNDAPDAWIKKNKAKVGIEVTVAASRAQVEGGRHLNNNGVAFGDPTLPDDASKSAFTEWSKRERILKPVKATKQFVRDQILNSLLKKNKTKYIGMHLLIQFPPHGMERHYWNFLVEELRDTALTLPFSEVHLISKAIVQDYEPYGFQLK